MLRIAAWEMIFGGTGSPVALEARMRDLISAGAALDGTDAPFALDLPTERESHGVV